MPDFITLNFDAHFRKEWHRKRHLARTDLLWLCREVLGYRDVSREVHGELIDTLQKFPGAVERHRTAEDYLAAIGGKVLFAPLCKMEELPANPNWTTPDRQCLFLYPRGHLKTTVCTVAHSIQWILNYPNVRILLTSATEELTRQIAPTIRDQFIQNENLRFLFPDICPPSRDGKVPEMGNLYQFTIPARDNNNRLLGPGGKEPTLLATTVGSAITGYHGDVFKCDDMVEKINSSSQNGIADVIRHAGAMGDLLEKYNSTSDQPLTGWVDMVGTPWDFSDLYQVIRNDQEARKEKGLVPSWNLCIVPATRNWPQGPFLWPQRMGYAALKKIEDDPTKGPSQLSAQYLLNPIQIGAGLIDDPSNLFWMPQQEMDARIGGVILRGRLDLAGMDSGSAKGTDNDYTCLSVAGFKDGLLMVPWMRYGREPIEGVVEWIFSAFAKYPQMVELRIERASGANPLESWLRREMAERGKWLPITFETRTNKESKVNRIKALRPWFMDRKIALSTFLSAPVPRGMGYGSLILNEIKGFPKYRHDDFLDTLSDHMLNNKGGVSGAVAQTTTTATHYPLQTDRFSRLLAGMHAEMEGTGYDSYTGFPV